MADRIQQRRDTAARWAQFNPILLEGEVGYVTDDPNQYKIGDGVHAWNDLPLRGFDGTLVHELGDSQTAAMSQQGVTDALIGQMFSRIQMVTNGAIISIIERDCIKENYYITSGGVETSLSGARTSDFIPVQPNHEYEYYGVCLDLAAICFYTDNNDLISGVRPDVNKDVYNFTTPENCKFVRYCSLNNSYSHIRYVGKDYYVDNHYKEKYIDPMLKDIPLRSILNNNLYKLEVTYTDGYYVDRIGNKVNFARGHISNAIFMNKGELLILNANGGSSGNVANVASISITDKDSSFYSPVVIRATAGTSENSDSTYSMYYADGDCYVALSWIYETFEAYKTKSDILNQIWSIPINICTALFDGNNKLVSGLNVNASAGIYLRKNGNLGTGLANGGVTDYFYVKNLTKLHYSGLVVENPVDVAVIIFYDDTKNLISSIYTINTDNATGDEGEITSSVSSLDIDVPSNAVWARCSSYTTANFKVYALQPTVGFDYIVNELTKLSDNLGFVVEKAIPQYFSNIMALSNGLISKQILEANIEGSYINRGGNTAPLSSGRISSPIQVSKGEVIVFAGQGGSSGSTPLLASISKTDAEGSSYTPVIIRGNFGQENLYSTYYVEEDGYLAFSWVGSTSILFRTTSDILNQLSKSLSNIKNSTDDNRLRFRNEFYVWFNDCICIGDSVTQGHVYDYPRTKANGDVLEQWSYPTQLAKMTKWTIENAAKAGITTINWWKTYYPNYTYTNYQIAIMELGYNGGLTDTLDTDVEPYDNYEDYAETNTGCYCKIIEAIKESNPNIYFILLIPSLWTTDTTGSVVIRKIAEKYGLPYIDLSDKTYMNLSDEKYHGLTSEDSGLNMVHFNAMGYLAKAQFIFLELNRLMEDNAKEINDIHGNYQ